jgi:hypothetical protein
VAALVIVTGELVVRLTPLEKLGALHGDIRVPLSAVRSAELELHPWRKLRGARVGTGLPGVIVLGTLHGTFGKDFVAVYGHRPATLVELNGQKFQRLIVCTADPPHDHAMVRRLAPHAGQKVQEQTVSPPGA